MSATLNGAAVPINGTQTVSPTATTTYTLAVTNSAGVSTSAQATVTVAAGAPTGTITANPTTVASGANSTLTWTSTNAASAKLNGAAVAVNGTQTVSPTATTTYTLALTNAAGVTTSVQVTVTVTATGPPTAGITENPITIGFGGSSTLTWATTNAASADLNGTAVALNGSQVVSPTATTTYRLTAHSSTGATDWGQVTLSVTGATPTAAISANPTTVASGGSSTLTWTSSNAATATLNGAAVAVSGTTVVSPTATTSYNLVVTSAGGATTSVQTVVTVSSTGSSITGQWTPVQTWPYMAAHAHLLVNGKVIFWPSYSNGNTPTLWDPIANSFSTPPKAPYNLFCSGHSLLQDGRLFVAGGHAGNNSDGLVYSTVYDPIQNKWTQTANMSDARWYPTNTTLPNGDVLVVSGYSLTGTFNTMPQVWNPATNVWRNLSSAQLMLPLYPWMFVAPNGKVFNAGDATEARTSTLTSRYLDTSGTGAWTPVGTYNYTGLRDYGSAVMFDGKVLIVGGDGAGTGPATNTAEIIDLNATSPTWNYTGSLAVARRQHNLTLLADGKVLATGGSGGGGFDNETSPVYAAEMWDPASGTWSTMASTTMYRGYHSTALLLPDGRVVSAGGEKTGASAEIYSPPYLFNGARPTIGSAPSTTKYTNTFFVATPDAADIKQVTWIRLGSVTHSFGQNQRLNHLQFAQAAGGLNVTAPANANVAPPGHYMLFLVNSKGVPSVAAIIQITN